MAKTSIHKHFEEAHELLTQLLQSAEFENSVVSSAQLMVESLKKGGKIISCDIDGSMCDALHFADELI